MNSQKYRIYLIEISLKTKNLSRLDFCKACKISEKTLKKYTIKKVAT